MEKEYLEKDLPEFLVHSIEQMKESWELYEKNRKITNPLGLRF